MVPHPMCWGGNGAGTPQCSHISSSSPCQAPSPSRMAAGGLLCFEGLLGQISVLKNELSAEMQQQTEIMMQIAK